MSLDAHGYLAAPDQPTRAAIDALAGPVVLEFGTPWCGYCRALAPKLTRLLGEYPEVLHLKIEDGPGLPLGRSFRVRLWPTLVVLRDGQIAHRLARPEVAEVRVGLAAICADSSG